MSNQSMNHQSRAQSSQLIDLKLVSELKSITEPTSEYIDIAVRFWLTPQGDKLGLTSTLPYHKGTEGPHPNEGGDSQSIVQFLGTYEGPLPSNGEVEELVAKLKGKSKQEQTAILQSELCILYGYYPYLNGGIGAELPIIKGSTLSFFISWEQHQHIENTMKSMGVNAIIMRVKVPQVCRVFEGTARDSSQRPLFSGTFYDVSFLDAPAVRWTPAYTFTFPVIIPQDLLSLPQLQFQQAAIDAQAVAGAAAGYRNRQLAGESPLPFYMQQRKGQVMPTMNTSSLKVDTESMKLETPVESIVNPLSQSDTGSINPIETKGTSLT